MRGCFRRSRFGTAVAGSGSTEIVDDPPKPLCSALGEAVSATELIFPEFWVSLIALPYEKSCPRIAEHANQLVSHVLEGQRIDINAIEAGGGLT